MKGRTGRVQTRVRRGLLAADGRPMTTEQLLPWCYPRWPEGKRWQEKHRRSLRRGALKFATAIGKRKRELVWALKKPK